MKILVTGAGGFIGHALCEILLKKSHDVIGLDREQPNPLRSKRLQTITSRRWQHRTVNYADTAALNALFNQHLPQVVVHLASQAASTGGELSDYLQSNVTNHNNVLEAARQSGSVQHIIYASSYAVYGHQNTAPFTEDQPITPPTSPYAASKYDNEVTTQAWAAQSDIACTALRLFNVYGPWGRPGTMPTFFAEKLLNGESIPLHANGELIRDFVYIDDVTAAIAALIEKPLPGHSIFNIGSSTPTTTREFLNQLAHALNCTAVIENQPAKAHEVMQAYPSIAALQKHTGWTPQMPLAQGLKLFAEWFKTQG